MKNLIDSHRESVSGLLSRKRYYFEYYQREYKWTKKNIVDLLNDLESKFFMFYKSDHDLSRVAADYGSYFLGSVIVSNKDGKSYIVDGQQRITSLILLLIYLYNNLDDDDTKGEVRNLIFVPRGGKRIFNIDVPDRAACMDVLMGSKPSLDQNASESARNMYERYQDIVDNFHASLKGDALPFFVEWLLDNVIINVIETYADEDAYVIFETMNDRGLSLSQADMLRGYLLSRITPSLREEASDAWKKNIDGVTYRGQRVIADERASSIVTEFFKVWLAAKYARTFVSAKGSSEADVEWIGTRFHEWLRKTADRRGKEVGLVNERDFYDFIANNFAKFGHFYTKLNDNRRLQAQELSSMYYEHYMMRRYVYQYDFLHQAALLAPLRLDDSDEVAEAKINLVDTYFDIYSARAIWNSGRPVPKEEEIFKLILAIRDLDVKTLASTLKEKINRTKETFRSSECVFNEDNQFEIRYLLARITYYVEVQSGINSSFLDYVRRSLNAFDIEHIWFRNVDFTGLGFSNQRDFLVYRNRLGGLLLLSESLNRSLQALPYEEKLKFYIRENVLAASLNPDFHKRNKSLASFIKANKLERFFKSYDHFGREELDERQDLYRQIAERIWSLSRFDEQLPK